MPTLTLSEFTTEAGVRLHDVPVAYAAWGTLDADGRNALVVCHALTGSADAADWWAPLVGPGRALDTDRFYVVCLNVPGSPYGSVSPLTPGPDGTPYGVHFPRFTVRDAVALHRAALEKLGVRQVACAIGGSMGGMQVLEWAFEGDFVRTLVPIAVGGRHSAWCIAWSEAQRQTIYADAAWQDGAYPAGSQPRAGLAAARMMAMVSYRSQPSFEARFGRSAPSNGAYAAARFDVESYLRYQGDKLVDRFDARCYVHLTHLMDSHDVARGRGPYEAVLEQITQPTLVVGIDSDVLYPLAEQQELAWYLPNADLHTVVSPHGHDAFLIEFDQLADRLSPWIDTHLPNPAPTAA